MRRAVQKMDMQIREYIEKAERTLLFPYASFAADTRGREREEEPCELRTAFQRDRDRILHSKSFRRLKHKTQVFLSPEGDHYRTRLTHTLEVAQIARTIARSLRLNEDLTEAIALGHDLGHTPFGHAGEKVLNRVSPYGFSHSEQSRRVVECLENNHRGLNLTEEVRDGIVCHNGDKKAQTLEGQIVKYADRIAYINHDIDDAMRAGILAEKDIPREIANELGHSHSARIDHLIKAIVRYSYGKPIVGMDDASQAAADELRAFMFANVYTNPIAKNEEKKVVDIIGMLYRHLVDHPEKLPESDFEWIWKEGIDRVVCDHIAGMSDRYAIGCFEKFFVPRIWNA